MEYYHDKPYLGLLRDIMEHGVRKENRTGVDTIAVFSRQMRFKLYDGSIPLLTTKKMHWKSIIHELLWYISGSTNNNDLEKYGVRIWREWADDTGNLGPLYGHQLRKWNSNGNVIDQLQEVINTLKTNPNSRRMVVSYWDPSLLPDERIPPHENVTLGRQSLAPCHYTFQLYTRPLERLERIVYGDSGKHGTTDKELDRWRVPRYALSLDMTQRSVDSFLGCPFNIAQYSILLHMLAHISNMLPEEFVWSGKDCHIYINHMEQIKTQLQRTPFSSPRLTFARKVSNIDDFKFDDFILNDYNHHAPIKAKVAI